MLTVESKVHFEIGRRSHKQLQTGVRPEPPAIAEGTVPRVARLMALAIRMDHLLREGVAKNYSDLATLGAVTRARMTQIMNLLLLAPDIQEAILFLPRTTRGRDVVTEPDLRSIVSVPDWGKQRRMWRDFGTPFGPK